MTTLGTNNIWKSTHSFWKHISDVQLKRTQDNMERLPEEVVLQILSYLAVPDIVSMQLVSHRYLTLSRDNALWKAECFNRSQAESLRRRQQLRSAQDSRLAELRNAVSALPGADLTAWDVSRLRGSAQPRATPDPHAEARTQRQRALANWEPGYPGEPVDYYEEFVHRHAETQLDYLALPKAPGVAKEAQTTATGVGMLGGEDGSQHVVAPLDDGSLCIWDVTSRGTNAYGGGGKCIAQSRRGLLSGQAPDATSESHTIMTETGAVECVAIDSEARKGYFAVQSLLHEVDLSTLQLASSKQYPWPITALSEAKDNTPVTVGTNLTIHLHDPRDSAFAAPSSPTAGQGELIGGSVYSHVTLEQPGPLSILHHDPGADDSSIWVSGRFTSLLNYDRRFFPRLRGTIFSGARVASLTSLPYPFVPQRFDLVRNPDASLAALLEARVQHGTTMMAAAEYKGKGSLELYGLPSQQEYKNRQTASASKLLSVAPHGGKIVLSDGDGNLKWVERDGYSFVRTFNINDPPPGAAEEDASSYGIWSSTASEMPGQGDIVQKIIPTAPLTASHAPSSASNRPDTNTSNLLLWTGDGYLGLLGFGHTGPLSSGGSCGAGEEDSWHDAVESQAQDTEARAKEDAERQYGMAMRRALERNADEVRFVRGLGMGEMRP